MAQLYPRSPSVAQGGTIVFHVSSATTRFRIDIYRYGTQLVPMASANLSGGFAAPKGSHDSDWGWPGFAFQVSANWPSGVYLAQCVEDGAPVAAANPDDPANRFAQAIFVVRSATPGSKCCILYKLPLFTYAAYNELADPPTSLYTGGGTKVTLRRPGHGAGADPWDASLPDFYDTTSPRQTFAHWDLKFVRWLESRKYEVDYCTDLDVHQNPGGFISQYRLILSVGHDEYWSTELRDHLEQFVANGGNLAFFSGNVCWWRVHVVDGDTAIYCNKAVDQWWSGTNAKPENSITGVSYRNAGGHWTGARTAIGYSVQYASHWVYQGVLRADGSPIQEGDSIGGSATEALVGYECDGARLMPAVPGMPRVVAATDGTPSTFLVLGVAQLSGWEDMEAGAASTATMGLYTQRGIVFNAATTDWARLLASRHAQVDRITRNVLDRLRSRAVRILGLKGACSNSPVVEGASVTLYADVNSLPNTSNLTYAWHSSAGIAGATNQPSIQLTLPSPPVPVTVSVTISDGTDCPGFGTLTFVPMTHAEYAHAQAICAIRELVITSAVWKGPARNVRDKVPWLVDPLWDPIKSYVGPAFHPSILQRLNAVANALAKVTKRASKSREASSP